MMNMTQMAVIFKTASFLTFVHSTKTSPGSYKVPEKADFCCLYARASKPSNLRGDRVFRQPKCKLCKPSPLKCFSVASESLATAKF